MGTDGKPDSPASINIELDREDLRLLIHAAALGAPNVGSAEDTARLRKLLQRLQGVKNEAS